MLIADYGKQILAAIASAYLSMLSYKLSLKVCCCLSSRTIIIASATVSHDRTLEAICTYSKWSPNSTDSDDLSEIELIYELLIEASSDDEVFCSSNSSSLDEGSLAVTLYFDCSYFICDDSLACCRSAIIL
jgi:hypothetical protein